MNLNKSELTYLIETLGTHLHTSNTDEFATGFLLPLIEKLEAMKEEAAQ